MAPIVAPLYLPTPYIMPDLFSFYIIYINIYIPAYASLAKDPIICIDLSLEDERLEVAGRPVASNEAITRQVIYIRIYITIYLNVYIHASSPQDSRYLALIASTQVSIYIESHTYMY